MKNFDLATLLAGIIPVMLAAMWWVISNVNELRGEIQLLQANMMMLVSPQGQIIPSPGNAFARHELKEEIFQRFADLHVRVKLLEAESEERQ
jgi:hypothetical protein|tara:strand:+ start:1029 stop:1304 length:276 start_codon:yes stop_codon:yes gene_type:complete